MVYHIFQVVYHIFQMMAAVLESLIFLVVESSQLEYETFIQPSIRWQLWNVLPIFLPRKIAFLPENIVHAKPCPGHYSADQRLCKPLSLFLSSCLPFLKRATGAIYMAIQWHIAKGVFEDTFGVNTIDDGWWHISDVQGRAGRGYSTHGLPCTWKQYVTGIFCWLVWPIVSLSVYLNWTFFVCV